MVLLSDEKIMDTIREAYKRVYEEDPGKLRPEQKIYKDLHADNPDKSFALELRMQIAKNLGIKESILPKPEESKDYTVG